MESKTEKFIQNRKVNRTGKYFRMMKFARAFFAIGILSMAFTASPSFASEDKDKEHTDAPCPVGLITGMTLDDEFGPGTSELTRCLKDRTGVKWVMPINRLTRQDGTGRAYGLGNIQNLINDYEITHGMTPEDYEIVAVVYAGGYAMVLDNNAETPHETYNEFQAQMESLLAQGVKIYLCQNTARSRNVKTANLIKGVKYVTAAGTAVVDFEQNGYVYFQP